jgi:DMSO/TMAO reductase YedYZ heme-binding membrane subunit
MNWFIIRGSGLAAFAFLAASTIWGLLVAGGYLGRLVKAKPLTYMHESLAVAAIVSTIVHLGTLGVDEFIEFGPRELFVPGASTYRPLWVSFGIVAFYGMVLVSGSFYIRKYIGQKAWRAAHYTTFGIFAASAAHGIMAGTDSSNPYVYWLYVGSAATVLGLVTLRVLSGGAKAKRKRPATAPLRAAPAPALDADDAAAAA